MPPSYDYHLKFELYPSPDPTADTIDDTIDPAIWRPAAGASIFDYLPWHSGRSENNRLDDRREDRANRDAAAAHIGGVIDCSEANKDRSDDGAAESESEGNFVRLSERQRRARTPSVPAPGFAAGLGPATATRDWRFGRVQIASFDMASRDARQEEEEEEGGGDSGPTPAASLGPTLGGAGQATRARYSPLAKTTNAGWGIVHLYREGASTPSYNSRGGGEEDGGHKDKDSSEARGHEDGDGSDGTILCIPAVPSYLTPSDFLGFVGETWRTDVSHYRMVMTSRTNRYMVLVKFRDARRAREWRAAFDGRVFNSMEAEICHATFIKSITIETPGGSRGPPAGSHGKDKESENATAAASSSFSTSLRPLPPPTPNLIEMPTCPVCLERMDDTTGLVTILCQHVFHCTCLQTWKGSGCPVCRATNPTPMLSGGSGEGASGGGPSSSSMAAAAGGYDASGAHARPFGAGVSNLCSVCDCADDLWICLICGYVGCGRYKRGHAKDHWKETAHSFSLELETQHVWDYAGDMWVHRLIRDKGDGKVVELPGQRPSQGNRQGGGGTGTETDSEDDVVPRAKLDSIGMEYTHLLTSQLESQRVYFEELVNKAADKAAKAAAAAEAASAQTAEAGRELRALRTAQEKLVKETVPALEREVARERRRADMAVELAQRLGRSQQEETQVSDGLMARIRHMHEEMSALQEAMARLHEDNETLAETNRDLSMFISGQEKLRELEAEGQLEAGEVAGGTVSVAKEKKGSGSGSGSGKGKGKGRRR